MTVTLDSFLEMVDPPTMRMGFSLNSSRATCKYYVAEDIESAADLQAAITLLLGGTTDTVSDGRMTRTPPIAHPIFPFLYASAITDLEGVGEFTYNEADAEETAATLPAFAMFDGWEFTVEFTPRPYAVLADTDITQSLLSWTDFDGSTITTIKTNEHIRFSEYQVQSKEEWITALQGQMVFRTGSGGSPGGSSPTAFAAQPRIFMPNQVVKFICHGVPYRYVTSANSFLSKYVGRINQNPWYDWDQGQLLYMGWNPIRFQPPIQQEDEWYGFTAPTFLADIELTFIVTNRIISDPPGPMSLDNANWVPKYHNAMPWFGTRGFYYVSVSGNNSTPEDWIPFWFSVPFEILLSDPDA